MTDHQPPTTDHQSIRLDHFMSSALTAYYGSRDPLGAEGDFTTAPEISQLFGEMIGIWAVQQWVRMGSPSPFNLIELGPGRGTLMADLLRGTSHIPGFHNAMRVHMVEMSPILRETQKRSVNSDRWSVTCTWHDHLSKIPNDVPALIIANEFFDALPIRQFKYNDGAWQEHYIDGEKSLFVAMDYPPTKSTLPSPPKHGNIFEYSKDQEDYARLISTYQGAAVIIDYGYVKSAYGDSLQALYKHKPCAITHHIGEADLTSHIDFEWLASFFKKNKAIKTQSQFLQENGITIRYRHLNNPDLQRGYERLLHPDQMGDLFKVLELTL